MKFISCVGVGLLAAVVARAAELPVVDLSGDAARQVVIAQGTDKIYQGHPTTLLLPDGKTIYAVWTLGHGGGCGPMKRSDDGGKTWSALLPTPENWTTVKNCPALYRLSDPQGVTRLFVFAGQGGPDHTMHQGCSTDDGKTWSPMVDNGLACVMPFCTITPVEGGKKLLGMTSIRRPGEKKDLRSNIITQSLSSDGGQTWNPWRILLDLGERKPCEPALVRSPDGKQLLCLLRENKERIALYMTSDDEGQTWSATKPLPAGLFGDRHMPRYAPDGRLVVCMRDTGKDSPTKNHFVAWVGRYEDILAGRPGQYRIKLLHSHAGSDCGYPGLELLPDGTFVATTYIKYRAGAEKQSVVNSRFTLAEIDKLAKESSPVVQAQPPAVPQGPSGLVMDDDAAELTGDWVKSTKQPALVGTGYRHDNNRGQGTKTARFAPDLPAAGRYEVRLLYVANPNRATHVPVTITSADGATTVYINQREDAYIDGLARSLGLFRFAAGKGGAVVISNTGTTGFVNVDAVEFVPEDLAQAERATAVTQPKMVVLAVQKQLRPSATVDPVRSAGPEAVDGKSYDLVVIGATPGGIACAVRAAREGLRVLLVHHLRHLGGFMTSGAGGWEAPYDGLRAPLYAEMRTGAATYYSETYGEGSAQHRAALPDPKSNAHIARPKIEPRIAELLFNRMVEREQNLTVLTDFFIAAAERDGALLRHVTLRAMKGERVVRVSANIFADGMYEADLAAAAQVPCRIGREARAAYSEPHAGVIYTTDLHKEPGQLGFPKDASAGRLKIRYNSHATGKLVEGPHSGEADGSVMAYNYRLILTRDPANRVMVAKPAHYDPDIAKAASGGGFVPNVPNGKVAWNGGRLIGPQNDYSAADWPTRERISRQYLDAMLMRLWYLQNDPGAPEQERAKFAGYGLAADEFPDNDHAPYEIYVREARRLVGRHIFTEHDNLVPPGLARTPLHPDSIAITDWPVDSVACLKRTVPGGNLDGIFFLGEETRPAQVPYRALLPRGVDNLLVPVALSASHVGWGAIRLEPVWMQTGEAAGFAAALAVKNKTTPAQLDPELLVRTLVKNRVMVSFFNDVDVTSSEPWVAAVQYFGTKGFFSSYDAKPAAPLTPALADIWAKGFAQLRAGTLDPNALARAVAAAEAAAPSAPTTKPKAATRAETCLRMFAELEKTAP
jgi:hypothetical protein